MSPIEEEEKGRDSEGNSFVRNKPSLNNNRDLSASQNLNSIASMAFEEPVDLLI